LAYHFNFSGDTPGRRHMTYSSCGRPNRRLLGALMAADTEQSGKLWFESAAS